MAKSHSHFCKPIKTRRDYFRAMVVWTKRHVAPGKGWDNHGISYFHREDGTVYVSRVDRDIKHMIKVAVIWIVADPDKASKEVRQGSIAYMRKNNRGAISLP